ncbi:MAG: TetR/AcrR family transcriptional regulator [Pseudomonadota bacterium]
MTQVGQTAKRPYHHGDLRTALLAAAEQELVERGIEDFSLRSVAQRAGVSHTAPKHHFGSADGLLTALSAIGFERFVQTQTAMKTRADSDPVSQLEAAGLGYVAFAEANPAMFRLMFASERPERTAPELADASKSAFDALVTDVANARRFKQLDPDGDETAVAAAWATAHGLADLLISERLNAIRALGKDDKAKVMARILSTSALSN